MKNKIIYLLIAVLAYLAGDQKLFDQITQKITPDPSLGKEEKVQSANEKIYFIGKYKVIKVVDGDTFHVKGEEGKEDIIRILAVDTLEKNSKIAEEKCFANKQTDFTKQNLLNKEVFLFGDKTQTKRDKYRRLLAYVATSTANFTSADENYFFNDYLIETGNAKIYRAVPPAYKLKIFEQKEKLAKMQKFGLWGSTCIN